MSDLARQPPLLLPLPDAAGLPLPPLPSPADGGAVGAAAAAAGAAAGSGEDSVRAGDADNSGGGLDPAQAMMLAMLMAQGMLPPGMVLPMAAAGGATTINQRSTSRGTKVWEENS